MTVLLDLLFSFIDFQPLARWSTYLLRTLRSRGQTTPEGRKSRIVLIPLPGAVLTFETNCRAQWINWWKPCQRPCRGMRREVRSLLPASPAPCLTLTHPQILPRASLLPTFQTLKVTPQTQPWAQDPWPTPPMDPQTQQPKVWNINLHVRYYWEQSSTNTDGRIVVEILSHRYHYRGSSLIRNSALLGPYSRTMPRAPWWS